MNSNRPQEELFNREEIEGGDDGIVVINERCRIQTRDGYRVVMVSALPLAYYPVGDRAGQAYAMVSLATDPKVLAQLGDLEAPGPGQYGKSLFFGHRFGSLPRHNRLQNV